MADWSSQPGCPKVVHKSGIIILNLNQREIFRVSDNDGSGQLWFVCSVHWSPCCRVKSDTEVVENTGPDPSQGISAL